MGVSGEYEVVVVGGGIMGSCTAYQVAKRGASVLLLEQFDLLHRRGSSHGETRTIRIAYPEPYYTQMMKEAFSLWYQAQQEAGYMVHTPSPHLEFGPPSNASLQHVLSSCTLHSIPFDTLSPHETSARFPAFTFPDDNYLAVVTQQGGVIHASKAVAMFHALALKHGAVLCDRIKVTNIKIKGAKMHDGDDAVLITTDQGSVAARKCVIAAGAWTRKLVKEISNIDLPIQPLHTTIAYWQIEEEAVDSFSIASGFPSFASYCDPHIYGNASIELPGLIKVNLDSGYACDPDKRALIPDRKALTEIVSPWLETHFKGKVKSDAPILAEACMYSMTPDEDFILDFLPMDSAFVWCTYAHVWFPSIGWPYEARILNFIFETLTAWQDQLLRNLNGNDIFSRNSTSYNAKIKISQSKLTILRFIVGSMGGGGVHYPTKGNQMMMFSLKSKA